MAFGMGSEYAVAALLVALAVWKLATNEGLDAFEWGFRDAMNDDRRAPAIAASGTS